MPRTSRAASATTRPGRNNGPEIADLGAATPKALVESMAKVLGDEGKPHGWLGFQPPANRALAKEQLKLTLQLGAKAKALVELVQARIGKMEAGMIKSMESGVNAGGELTLRYQMSQIAPGGKVDWDTLRITESGDKAQVAIPSMGATIQLAKVNGKWYLDQEAFAKDAPGVKEMTGTLMKVLDQVEQKVKSGRDQQAELHPAVPGHHQQQPESRQELAGGHGSAWLRGIGGVNRSISTGAFAGTVYFFCRRQSRCLRSGHSGWIASQTQKRAARL